MNVSIKGKDKILKHFSDNKFPFWRLALAEDARSVIAQNFEITDMRKSFETLKDVIDNIEPSNIYILESYKKTDEKRYTKPDTSVNFIIDESATVGNTKVEPVKDYTPASLKSSLELIETNAKLSSEIGILKFQLEQANKTITELNSHIVDLEEELDELEEGGEGDINGMGGTPMERALSKLLEENGATIIENFMPKKNGESKLNPEVKITGLKEGDAQMPDFNVCIDILKQHDVQLHYHLYKLVLIAQQMPGTFKTLLKKIDEL